MVLVRCRLARIETNTFPLLISFIFCQVYARNLATFIVVGLQFHFLSSDFDCTFEVKVGAGINL